MATKTEKISEEIVENIKSLQNNVNGFIFDLGQLSLRKRDLNLEITRLEEIKKEIEEKIDNKALQLENILSDLQKKYKDAEIDLDEGKVTYQVAD